MKELAAEQWTSLDEDERAKLAKAKDCISLREIRGRDDYVVSPCYGVVSSTPPGDMHAHAHAHAHVRAVPAHAVDAHAAHMLCLRLLRSCICAHDPYMHMCACPYMHVHR